MLGVALKISMQVWTYGIWFLGSAVWLVVAALSLRVRGLGHTVMALVIAIVFFAAGMFFARPGNQPRRRP